METMTKHATQSITQPITPQNSTEMLRKHSFWLIEETIKIWKSYREVGKSKASKIRAASVLHKMITDAIRADPDLQDLEKLHQIVEQTESNFQAVSEEFEALKQSLKKSKNPKTEQKLKELSPPRKEQVS